MFFRLPIGDNFSDFKNKYGDKSVDKQPGFILFYQPVDIENRVMKMKEVYPELEFEVLIEPGFMDKVMYWLNPINSNQNIYIYRNKAVIADKIQQ